MFDGITNEIAQIVQQIRDWASLVALCLIWISLVLSVTSGFVIWGVLRTSKLVRDSIFVPPSPGSYLGAPQGPQPQADYRSQG